MAIDQSSSIPATDVIERRLWVLRKDIIRAQGVCELGSRLDKGDVSAVHVLSHAIESLAAMLEDTSDAIDSDMFLSPETREERELIDGSSAPAEEAACDSAKSPRDRLESRIETQRSALFRAEGICACISKALDNDASPIDGKVSEEVAVQAHQALEHVVQMIEEIVGALDPANLLSIAEVQA